MSGAVAAVLALYVAALLLIAWRAQRRTHGGEDFHLAGRSLGPWAAGISSTASSESGWVTLGAVGMTYVHGISGLWYAPGCLLGYLANLYVVAPRLRQLSLKQRSLTLADVLSRRWGDPRHVVRLTAVAIVVASMMTYVAAQMTAAGKAIQSTLGIGALSLAGLELSPYALGVLVGALVITAVTALGGFRSVAWTDLFQGLLMAAALIALPLYAVASLGGFGTLWSGLAAANPHFLSATGGMVGSALLGFIVGELGIGLGYPGMPHVVTRYMAARSEEDLRRMRLIGMLWGVAVFYGAGLVGLAARVMAPALPDPEQGLMVVAMRLLPPALAGLMLAAVISAILSTVSSQLLVAASSVSYDVVEGVLARHPDEQRSLRLGRLTVAGVGVLGLALALAETRMVFWFVLFAWSVLGASFAPLVLLAISGGAMNRFGALAGMLTGAGVSVVWKLGRGAEAAGGLGVAMGVLAAVVALALLGAATGRLEAGNLAALATAAGLTLLSWWLVSLPSLAHLYELVPAFALALLAALGVARFTRRWT